MSLQITMLFHTVHKEESCSLILRYFRDYSQKKKRLMFIYVKPILLVFDYKIWYVASFVGLLWDNLFTMFGQTKTKYSGTN